ncbi:MAG: hypothetical protein ACPGU1_15535 [Myxococcota bacterium]
MYLVAIHGIDPKNTTLAPTLARLLGCTAYEARGRLVSVGPSVIAHGSESRPLQTLASQLKAAGFRVLLLNTAAIERSGLWWDARSFELSPTAWRITTRDGERTVMKWRQVSLIVRGKSRIETSTTEVHHGKRFSAARAVASGGMVRKKKVRTETTKAGTDHEGFLHIYGPGSVIVIRESDITYTGLGAHLKTTRNANFTTLIEVLKRRTSHAPFDDRLLRHAGLVQILGPTLDPASHTHLASALLATVAAL